MKLTLVLELGGRVRAVHSDYLRKLDLGTQHNTRASLVEWDDASQEWVAHRVRKNGEESERGALLARGPDRRAVEAREVEVLMEEL